jgi:hypothetical protein
VRSSNNNDIVMGAAAGALAGFAASWAMNMLMGGVASIAGQPAGDDPQQSKFRIARAASDWQEKADPTGEAADRFTRKVFNRGLTERQRDTARPIVHYAFGTAAGAAYGALAESLPPITVGKGIPFALSIWIVGDEIANPLFGLSPPPNRIPLSSHLAQFAAHLLYGSVLELGRAAIRGSRSARAGSRFADAA